MKLTRTWQKSSRSGENNCLEARRVDEDDAEIRDSVAGDDGPVLRFNGPAWRTFIRDVQNGYLDRRDPM